MKRVSTLSQAGGSPASPTVSAHLRGDLPPDLYAPGPRSGIVERAPIDADFLDDLRRAHPEDAASWDLLADPAARVVATGQQPGILGGPLLVLYKAATAVALAQRTAARIGAPVLPVFWNATDDVDFDEIASVGWIDAADELFYLQMPREARRVEGFVGDLPEVGDTEALRALAGRIPATWRNHVEDSAPDRALDHGDWVAQWLRRLLPGLLVVDARSAVWRRHAAALFERYLLHRDEAHRCLEEHVSRLEKLGHRRVLSPASMRLGLFLTKDGTRQKTDEVDVLLQAVRRQPESVSPNVLLRSLVQDLLLPTVGFVAGPSEIGYLLELRALRRLLEVPEPALWSRLSGTVLPEAVWTFLQSHHEDCGVWLRSPEEALRRSGAREAQPAMQATEDVWQEFATLLSDLGAAGVPAAARERAAKALINVQQRLTRDIEEAATRELLRQSPRLRNVAAWLRPSQRPQERVLAGLWLVAQCGPEIGVTLVREATEHLEALERGVEQHAVWSLDAVPSLSAVARQEES
jgi:uncharacterized protein YllA (UPF0747 family)